ncbi:MAG: hypothetical protein ACN6O7_05095 [Sphingobacterium sp.]
MGAILLTGCIDPKGMILTALQNNEDRKLQYVTAIRYYLKETDFPIVFVENSGTDISNEFDDVEKKRLEFITFSNNEYDRNLGKGYGEMLILMKAVEQSKYINNAEFICKITGRYIIKNINSLLQSYKSEKIDIYGLQKFNFQFVDSRIFIAEKSFYSDFLFQFLDSLNDSEGVYFEHCLSKATLLAMASGKSFMPFKCLPWIVGQSGTDGNFYNSSIFHWLPRNLIQRAKYILNKINL